MGMITICISAVQVLLSDLHDRHCVGTGPSTPRTDSPSSPSPTSAMFFYVGQLSSTSTMRYRRLPSWATALRLTQTSGADLGRPSASTGVAGSRLGQGVLEIGGGPVF